MSVIIPFPLVSCPRRSGSHAVDEDCARLARRQPVELRKGNGRAVTRIVEAEVVAPGAFVASGSPRASKVATLPLVPPVSTAGGVADAGGYCEQRRQGAVRIGGCGTAPDNVRVSVSPGKKPSASSAANLAMPEETIGQSTKPRVTFICPDRRRHRRGLPRDSSHRAYGRSGRCEHMRGIWSCRRCGADKERPFSSGADSKYRGAIHSDVDCRARLVTSAHDEAVWTDSRQAREAPPVPVRWGGER